MLLGWLGVMEEMELIIIIIGVTAIHVDACLIILAYIKSLKAVSRIIPGDCRIVDEHFNTQRQLKLTKTFALMFATFLIGFLLFVPNITYRLKVGFVDSLGVFSLISYNLFKLYSAINPVTVMLMNKDFRPY